MERKGHTAHIGDGRGPALLPSVLRALFISLLAFGVLLITLTLLLSRTADPARLLTPLAIGAAGMISILGGLSSGRAYRTAGALAGLLHGMFLVFLFLLAATVMGGGRVEAAALPVYLGMLFLSTVGGRLATVKGQRRIKRHR